MKSLTLTAGRHIIFLTKMMRSEIFGSQAVRGGFAVLFAVAKLFFIEKLIKCLRLK